MQWIVWGSMMVVCLPVLVQAGSIQRVTGLANGKVRVTYTSGKASTEQIFSVRTAEQTLVEKISGKKFIALQPNGRKLAWVNAEDPHDFDIDRLTVVDDVSYTSAYLALPTFGDDRLPVVVAKRGATTDVLLIDREDDDLDIAASLRFENKNIVPSETSINESQQRIQLWNATGKQLEQITVVGGEDIQLVRQHDAVDCTGQWYETHAHMEDLDALDEYVERLKEHGIGCSLLFVGMEWDHVQRTYQEVQAIVENNPGRFIPFYNGDPNSIDEISVENLQAILAEDSDNLFRGIGEFAFYDEPLLDTALTDDPWPDIFQWAGDNDLIIMMHLNHDQATELDAMLEAYPTTTVLLHGRELAQAGDLATLLAEHSNLYFTLDTANMINQNGPLMFPVQGGDDDSVSDKIRANDFVEAYDANETNMLADAQTVFNDLFTVAPNQVLWGTDTAFTWHTRPAVYRRLIEFSEAFVVDMSDEQQADYLMNNAQELFGDGVTIE